MESQQIMEIMKTMLASSTKTMLAEMKANEAKADADRITMQEKMDDIKEIKEEMKANQAKMEANMGSMQAEL
jgi:hypothetical protein